MAAKVMIFAIFALVAFVGCSAGIVPAFPGAAYVAAPAAYVAPYASTYNAHVVNHAIAAPVVAAHAAPLVAAAHPYAAYPYAAYNQPLVVAK